MQALLNWAAGLGDKLFSKFLPAGIYAELDYLYNATLILLGAGLLCLVAAVVCVIVMVLRMKRRQEMLAE